MHFAKRRLLTGTLLSGLVGFTFAPAIASAQAAENAQAAITTPVDELVVTGSRIPRPNLEQPTPVSSINALAIQNAGATNLGDILAVLPAISSSGTTRAHAYTGENLGGLSYADLRGLGTSRTLVLVDGKRHVAGDAGDSAVDLSSIPTALVDRVEVITGGASAIYGSDAVTGVVNVILKRKFVGYEFGAQGGFPLNGDYGQNYSAYGIGGWNFAQDRGNVTLSLFGDRQERVRGSDIEGLADWSTVFNPADTGPNDGVPDRIFRPYVQSDYFSANGNLLGAITQTPVTGFDVFGNPVAIPPRTGTNNFFYGSHAADCPVCFSQQEGAVLMPRTRRLAAATSVSYEIAPSLTFRGDVKYVDSHVVDAFSPSFIVGAPLIPDNAFITPAIRAVMIQHPEQRGLFGVGRLNEDIGARTDYTRRKTFRAVLSLDGEVDAGFADVNWEASYNLGRTRNAFHSVNGLISGNFLAAVDAVVDPASGQIRCRKDVPARWYPGYVPPSASRLTNETCVPFNLFGQQNSRAAIDYVTFEGDRKHTITQQVAGLTFDFDTQRFFSLPGGPLAIAGGAEYRKEESRNINDALVQSGITEFAPQPNAFGGFEVKEAFAEFDAPILRGQPMAERLSLNAAVRYADYSHAGDATAYKVGGVWAPWKDLSFRTTYSRAVRAPNITEAFLPATSGFNQILDPCDVSQITARPNRAANCAALGVTFQNALRTSFPGVSSGNRDLDPETARTWTVGFVLQPRWTPGLSLSVDYYRIRIKDAISFLSPQDAANKCVDGPTLAPAYCGLIIRDPVTRQITTYRSSYLNQAALKTAGYDIQLAYSRDVGDWTRAVGGLSWLDGRLSASVNANYLEKLRQFAFQDFPGEVDRQEGEVGAPRWSFVSSTTYSQGYVSLTWNSRYIDKVRRDKDVSLERYDRPYVGAVWYQDFIGRYKLDNISPGSEVFLGMNNAFDKRVPLGLTGFTVGGQNQADYDVLGRYLFAGFKARF